jgi:DNA-binding FadR family transcriptional regulator
MSYCPVSNQTISVFTAVDYVLINVTDQAARQLIQKIETIVGPIINGSLLDIIIKQTDFAYQLERLLIDLTHVQTTNQTLSLVKDFFVNLTNDPNFIRPLLFNLALNIPASIDRFLANNTAITPTQKAEIVQIVELLIQIAAKSLNTSTASLEVLIESALIDTALNLLNSTKLSFIVRNQDLKQKLEKLIFDLLKSRTQTMALNAIESFANLLLADKNLTLNLLTECYQFLNANLPANSSVLSQDLTKLYQIAQAILSQNLSLADARSVIEMTVSSSFVQEIVTFLNSTKFAFLVQTPNQVQQLRSLITGVLTSNNVTTAVHLLMNYTLELASDRNLTVEFARVGIEIIDFILVNNSVLTVQQVETINQYLGMLINSNVTTTQLEFMVESVLIDYAFSQLNNTPLSFLVQNQQFKQILETLVINLLASRNKTSAVASIETFIYQIAGNRNATMYLMQLVDGVLLNNSISQQDLAIVNDFLFTLLNSNLTVDQMLNLTENGFIDYAFNRLNGTQLSFVVQNQELKQILETFVMNLLASRNNTSALNSIQTLVYQLLGNQNVTIYLLNQTENFLINKSIATQADVNLINELMYSILNSNLTVDQMLNLAENGFIDYAFNQLNNTKLNFIIQNQAFKQMLETLVMNSLSSKNATGVLNSFETFAYQVLGDQNVTMYLVQVVENTLLNNSLITMQDLATINQFLYTLLNSNLTSLSPRQILALTTSQLVDYAFNSLNGTQLSFLVSNVNLKSDIQSLISGLIMSPNKTVAFGYIETFFNQLLTDPSIASGLGIGFVQELEIVLFNMTILTQQELARIQQYIQMLFSPNMTASGLITAIESDIINSTFNVLQSTNLFPLLQNNEFELVLQNLVLNLLQSRNQSTTLNSLETFANQILANQNLTIQLVVTLFQKIQPFLPNNTAITQQSLVNMIETAENMYGGNLTVADIITVIRTFGSSYLIDETMNLVNSSFLNYLVQNEDYNMKFELFLMNVFQAQNLNSALQIIQNFTQVLLTDKNFTSATIQNIEQELGQYLVNSSILTQQQLTILMQIVQVVTGSNISTSNLPALITSFLESRVVSALETKLNETQLAMFLQNSPVWQNLPTLVQQLVHVKSWSDAVNITSIFLQANLLQTLNTTLFELSYLVANHSILVNILTNPAVPNITVNFVSNFTVTHSLKTALMFVQNDVLNVVVSALGVNATSWLNITQAELAFIINTLFNSIKSTRGAINMHTAKSILVQLIDNNRMTSALTSKAFTRIEAALFALNISYVNDTLDILDLARMLTGDQITTRGVLETINNCFLVSHSDLMDPSIRQLTIFDATVLTILGFFTCYNVN